VRFKFEQRANFIGGHLVYHWFRLNIELGLRNPTVWQASNSESFREQASNVQYSLISMENPNPEAKDRTGVIDVIAGDPKTGEVVLVMNEPNEWDGSDKQLLALQERFNAYVSFLLDGELAEAHPELVGKPARIELHCAQMPEARALEFLGLIHDQLAFQEIKLEVVIGEQIRSDEHCDCRPQDG
jgi:hypothetical protein